MITDKEQINIENKEQTEIVLAKAQSDDLLDQNQESIEDANKQNTLKESNSLEKAYAQLEEEFKKKCEQIESLQAEKEQSKVDYSSAEFIEKHILTNSSVVNRVISEYLKELASLQTPRTISESAGYMPFVPPPKPKSIAEAGQMAQKMLGNF